MGTLSFTLDHVAPGGSATVTLDLPPGVHLNTYYKYGPTPDNHAPHWYRFLFDGQTGAEINGNRVTLHFVDGGRGDDDLTANGVVVEPGGPVIDPAVSFVVGVYADVLHRTPDPTGVAYWLGALDAGMPRFVVARGFWESPEHRGLQVDDLYAHYLHRAAEPMGREGWVRALVGGAREEDVARAFIASPEYARLHADPASFVQGLYTAVLGRTADLAGEVQFWVGHLGQDLTPDAVAQAFLTSPEARRQLVDRGYLDFLHRPAEPASSGFVDALQQGRLSPAGFAETVLASDEYFARLAGALP